MPLAIGEIDLIRPFRVCGRIENVVHLILRRHRLLNHLLTSRLDFIASRHGRHEAARAGNDIQAFLPRPMVREVALYRTRTLRTTLASKLLRRVSRGSEADRNIRTQSAVIEISRTAYRWLQDLLFRVPSEHSLWQ